MPNSLRRFLGALVVTGVVCAVPATAATHAAVPVQAAGGGSGCNDHYPPHSNWGNGWWDHDGNGPYWRGWNDGNGDFYGHAYDNRCYADHAGRVARVMVAVERVRGSHCERMHRSGFLGPRVSCGHPRWFAARGTRSWKHHIGQALPAGHYRLHRRAVDAAGNRERMHTKHVWIR